tara:strand:+ start:10069 stop:10293 length:225 start_codon:yes stop_codon:yes gene_type:complete
MIKIITIIKYINIYKCRNTEKEIKSNQWRNNKKIVDPFKKTSRIKIGVEESNRDLDNEEKISKKDNKITRMNTK